MITTYCMNGNLNLITKTWENIVLIQLHYSINLVGKCKYLSTKIIDFVFFLSNSS